MMFAAIERENSEVNMIQQVECVEKGGVRGK